MDDAQNTHIFIGKNCRLHGIKITSYDSVQTKCVISEKTTMYGTQIQIMHNASCIIGKDCMFSYNTWIWGSDAHEIYDINTTDSLNMNPSTVYIGDHCWFGENSRLTKNASLADNTIVGCSSVVTKHYKESNIILAGNPAKIIKRNVNWNR